MINPLRKGFRCLLLAAGILFMLSLQAQEREKLVTLNLKNARLSDALNEVRKQTQLGFFYSVDDLNRNPRVSIQVSNSPLTQVLNQLLAGTDMQYSIEKNSVIIKRKPGAPAENKTTDTMVRVSGTVQSAKGSPLSGASIQDLSTGRSVMTDGMGKYSITTSRRTTLKITYIGMKPALVTIHGAEGSNTHIQNIQLQEAPSQMNDVVVTGYQSIRKSEMVGSANTVKREDMFYDGTNTIPQMLQGKLPGTVVINNNGYVGTKQKVRVRGTATLLSNQEPVWVVDGIIQTDPIPFQAQALNDVGNNFDMIRNFIGNSVAWLNPNDIEDVTVLKDAAATVLYGVKAANGVIVIKTKKGKQGRMSVNYSGGIAVTEKLNYDRLNLMNSKERIDVSREIYERRLLGTPVTTAVGYENVLQRYLNKEISYEEFNREVKQLEVVNTNWIDLLYRSPLSHNHSLSISGGNDKVTYYSSISASQNFGIAKGNDSRSYGGTINLDAKLTDKLTASVRLNGNLTKTNGFYRVDPFTYAQSTSRAIPAFDSTGKWQYYDLQGTGNGSNYKFNIFNELNETGNTNDTRSLNANINIGYNILTGLRYESMLGVTSSNSVGESYASEYSNYITTNFRGYEFGQYGVGTQQYMQSQLPNGGEFNSQEARNTSTMWRNSLAYNTVIGLHRFGGLIGQEMRSVITKGLNSTTYGYFPDRGRNITLPPRIINAFNSANRIENPIYTNFQNLITDREANFLSYYGSLTYSYNERYVFSGSLRSDASNRFGQDTRHRFLPIWAAGVRWNVHNEPWMANQNLVSELNVRASYGWQGNVAENFGPDLIAQLPGSVVNPTTGEYELLIKSLGYSDLRWEKTKTYNLGLDFGFAKNRFTLSVEYYNKRTEDMIIYKSIPVSYGITQMPVNGGSMRNYGFELLVSGTMIKSRDFIWNMTFNTSRNFNSITSQLLPSDNWMTAAQGQLYKQGYAVSSFWVFDYKGLDPKTGYPTFNVPTLAEKPNAINDATEYMKYAGRLDPDFTGGITNTFRYKSLTLSSSFNLSLGGKRMLYRMFNGYQLPSAYDNLPKEFAGRWKKPGDEKFTNIPSIPSLIYDPVSNQEINPWMVVPNASGFEYLYSMYNYSSVRVVSASFLRCNNISLSYNFPDKFVNHIGVKNVALTGSVSNPFIIVSKQYRGMDPEVATGNQPIPRTYSMILNVSF